MEGANKMPKIAVGAQFPDLKFETFRGEHASVKQAIASQKLTVFWLMRFIGCRFCQYDLDLLAEKYAAFTEKGAKVYVILQSTEDSISGLKGDFSLPYEIICDAEHVFYKTLDVRATATKQERMPATEERMELWREKKAAVEEKHYPHKSDEGEAQQLPALFMVGPDGAVRYAHYAVDSIDIPGIDEMLQLVDELTAQK